MFVNTGLIGYPLGHTFSPSLHADFMTQAGINGGYVCFEAASPTELNSLVNFLKKYKFSGVNVTVPYKLDIMKYCSFLEPAALDAGAVNTLKFESRGVYGYNTDVFGFSKSLETGGISVKGKKVLLLGAGGAAKSVIAYMRSNRSVRLTIANRTFHKAEALAESCGLDASAVAWNSLKGMEFDIIINSTSLGIKGEPFPPFGALCGEAAVDLQYKPFKTPFLSLYDSVDAKKLNGFSMLVFQAWKAFNIWTGADISPDIDRLSKVVYG